MIGLAVKSLSVSTLWRNAMMKHPEWLPNLINNKGQLFAVWSYLYVVEGRPYSIQVQQSASGQLTAHAESTSDPHDSIHPQSGMNLEDLLSAITHEIDRKVCKW